MATIDILAAVPRLPGPDEVLELGSLELQGGGPAASALAALGRLGTASAFVGTTDSGEWGDLIAGGLAECSVDTTHLLRRSAGSASRSVILIEPQQGRRSILYSKGTVEGLNPADLPLDLIAAAKILHLDGFHHLAAVRAAGVAREAGVLVSLDGGAGEPWPGTDQLLPLADILIVARQFAEHVTGLQEPMLAAEELARSGAQQVVVTDGEKGAWYVGSGESEHVPAFRARVVDTTGAGDSFHGGYLHALLAGRGLRERVEFAAAVAAQVCERMGGRAGLPDEAQVEAFLSRARAVR